MVTSVMLAASAKSLCEFSVDARVSTYVNFINGILAQKVIGGELLPINTTALILAGTQMTAAWLIPVIVSGIGFAIVILRKL